MTEQERAAALAWVDPAMEAIAGLEKDMGGPISDDFEIGRVDDSRHSPSFRIRVGHIRKLAALRAYARPAPADLRLAIEEAIEETVSAAERDGGASSAQIADAIIYLMPQTQERDVKWKREATAPYGVKVIAGWAPARGLGSHAELGKRHTDGSWSNNYGHPFSGKPDVWMEIPTIERLDRAKED